VVERGKGGGGDVCDSLKREEGSGQMDCDGVMVRGEMIEAWGRASDAGEGVLGCDEGRGDENIAKHVGAGG